MKLRTLIAFVLVFAAASLVGWGAVELAAWAVAPSAPKDAPVAEPAAAPPRVVRTTRIVREAPTEAVTPVRQNLGDVPGWDSSLLIPRPTMPVRPTPAGAPPAEPGGSASGPAGKSDARDPAGSAGAALPPPKKSAKPKPDSYDGRLTVAQVADIKRRLNLTAEQIEYWKPVEAALLAFAREQERTGKKLTLTPIESQNLYFAAGPLVMRLREDQKEEARNLARAMGLETVASLI